MRPALACAVAALVAGCGGEDVRLTSSASPVHASTCAGTHRIIAASRGVVVFVEHTELGRTRTFCGNGKASELDGGADNLRHKEVRIVNGRWILLRDVVAGPHATTGIIRVVDSVSARVVTEVDTETGRLGQTTLLPNGTLAWITPGGPLLVQRPEAEDPTELAPASAAPTALASAPHKIYWTTGGTAHAYRVR